MQGNLRPILVLGGSTATGKSKLAMQLAEFIPLEIVSADSRQVFQHLDIGTAKPSLDERLRVKHHCIDICHPQHAYNAAMYLRDARSAISSVPEDRLPVLVGGSGMYINAAVDGFSTLEVEPNEEIRADLQNQLLHLGIEHLYEKLVSVDPEAAERNSDKNPRRVMRALEYFATTNKKLSDSWSAPKNAAPYHPVFIGIRYASTQHLNERIDKRCEYMWADGLVKETQRVLQMGVDRYAQSLSTVGYRQVNEFLFDGIAESEAMHRMKVATRQYAKRQRTWFYRDQRYNWFEGSDNNLLGNVTSFLKSTASISHFVDLHRSS